MLFRHLIVIDNFTAIIIPVNTEQNEIVELWEMLLSREPKWIEKAFEPKECCSGSFAEDG